MIRFRPIDLAACAWVIAAAQLAHAAPPAPAIRPLEPAASASTTATDRKSVAITIYNNDVGLVRDVRTVRLPKLGRATITFADIAPSILPPSLALSVGPRRDALRILEQTYRYDILSPEALTNAADAASISIHRLHPGSGEVTTVRGDVLAAFGWGSTPVVRNPEGITFYPSYESLGFDKLPDRWSSRPSLAWIVDVRQPGSSDLDVSYLTGGMRWQADYVLTLPRNLSDASSITGWITLTNSSGMSFERAHIAVVAGRIHVVTRQGPMGGEDDAEDQGVRKSAEPAQAVRSQLAEYYLYDLPAATELPNDSTKQVAFVSSARLHVRRRYLVGPQPYWRNPGAGSGATVTEPVQVQLQFDLKESEGLGVPLPAGSVRVFAPDSRADLKFVGQAAVDHTPRDETVKLAVGVTSDVRLVRTLQERSGIFGHHHDRVAYRIVNSRSEQVTLEVQERAGELVTSSVPATHPDAATTTFTVTVPARSQLRWQAEYQDVAPGTSSPAPRGGLQEGAR